MSYDASFAQASRPQINQSGINTMFRNADYNRGSFQTKTNQSSVKQTPHQPVMNRTVIHADRDRNMTNKLQHSRVFHNQHNRARIVDNDARYHQAATMSQNHLTGLKLPDVFQQETAPNLKAHLLIPYTDGNSQPKDKPNKEEQTIFFESRNELEKILNEDEAQRVNDAKIANNNQKTHFNITGSTIPLIVERSVKKNTNQSPKNMYSKNEYETRYKCTLCRAEFKKRNDVSEHRRQYHSHDAQSHKRVFTTLHIPKRFAKTAEENVTQSDRNNAVPTEDMPLSAEHRTDKHLPQGLDYIPETKQAEVKTADIQNIRETEIATSLEKEKRDIAERVTNKKDENAYNTNNTVAENESNKRKRTDSNTTRKRSKRRSDDEDDSDNSENFQELYKRILKAKKTKQKESDSEESSQSDSSDSSGDDMLKKLFGKCVKKFLLKLKNKTDKAKTKPKQKLFKCKKCSINFLSKRKLDKHMNKGDHNSKGKYCRLCTLHFHTKTIKKHIKKHHLKMGLELKNFDIISGLSSSDSSDTDCSDSAEKTPITKELNLQPPKPKYSISNENQVNKEAKNPKSQPSDTKIHTSTVGNNKIPQAMDDPKAICRPPTVQLDGTTNNSHFVVYKCEKCDVCYNNLTTFNHHKADDDHNVVTKKQCRLCHLIFSATSLYKHMRVHHNENLTDPIKLDIMSSKDKMIKTLKLNKCLNFPLNTQKVNATTKLKKLKIAPTTYNRTIYKCNECNVCFITYSTLRFHVYRNKHNLTQIKECDTCHRIFSLKSMITHRRIHHRNGQTNTKFKVITLTEPVNTVQSNKNNKHQTTKQTFLFNRNKPIKPSLSFQQQKEVRNKKIKNKQCVLQNQNRQHLENASTEQEPKKNISNKTKSNTTDDAADIEKKLKIAPTPYNRTIYKCSECNVCFITYSTLRIHVARNKHNLTQIEECDTCHRIFSWKSMITHRRIHHRNGQTNTKFKVITLTEPVNTAQSDKNNPHQTTKQTFLFNRNKPIKPSLSFQKQKEVCNKKIKNKQRECVPQNQNRQLLEYASTEQEPKRNISNKTKSNTTDEAADIDDRLYKCTRCNIHYIREKTLFYHLASAKHDAKEHLPCSLCSYTFSYVTLKEHMNIQHYLLDIKRFLIVEPNSVGLKEPVVQLTGVQSILISTTSNYLNVEAAKLGTQQNMLHDTSRTLRECENNSAICDIGEEVNTNYLTVDSDDIENVSHMENTYSHSENIQESENCLNADLIAVKENGELFKTDKSLEEFHTIPENNTQETPDDTESHHNEDNVRNTVNVHKIIKILSDVVISKPLEMEELEETNENESQLINTREDYALNSEVVDTISSSTIMKASDTYDKESINFKDLPVRTDSSKDNNIAPALLGVDINNTLHDSAVNIITKGLKLIGHVAHVVTEDSCNSESTILTTGLTTESHNESKQSPEKERGVSSVDSNVGYNVTKQNKSKKETESRDKLSNQSNTLNKNMSKSTENLLKILSSNEDDSTPETNVTQEVYERRNSPADIPSKTSLEDQVEASLDVDIDLLKTKYTSTEENTDLTQNLSKTDDCEIIIDDETCNIIEDSTIPENNQDDSNVDDSDEIEAIQEKVSPFIEEQFEDNIEKDNDKEQNQHKVKRDLINIRFPKITCIADMLPKNLCTSKIDEDLSELENDLHFSTDTSKVIESRQVTVINVDDCAENEKDSPIEEPDENNTENKNNYQNQFLPEIITNIKQEADTAIPASLNLPEEIIIISDSETEE